MFFSGFWDAMVGREVVDALSTPNGLGRTDVQRCCWWGRGSLSIKGTCLYGKLNYHIGKKKAERDGRDSALFPDVDFCNDPGQICMGHDSIPLRWISGMYHWMENVQKYDREGFKYQDELVRYVNEDLSKEGFFEGATNIHVLGCHKSDCSNKRSLTDMGDRLRNFERVLSLFDLQFGSHADPEPPFQAFPGQQRPTSSPTMNVTEPEEIITPSPTRSPVGLMETVVVPVNVFLTGVPDGVNMTNNEQEIFERLMFDLLEFRLATVDIKVLDVKIQSQVTNPDFSSEFFSSSREGGGGGAADGEQTPVLQLVVDVTIGYSPPPPDGLRDWSIYLKSWIESFGNTMVEIFTSPKHVQHPQTNSKFWDDLSDVSATNVVPPNTEPTETPTQAPTQIIYPDNSKNTYIIAGVGAAVGLGLCMCCAFFCIKLRQYRRLQANLHDQKAKQLRFQQESDDEERRLHMRPDHDFEHDLLHQPLQVVSEDNSNSDSDSDDSSDSSTSSSSSSDDSSRSYESSSAEEEEESQYTEDDGTKSWSTYTASVYSEGVERAAPESATSRSTYEEEESVFTEDEGETESDEGESVEGESVEGESVSTYRGESVSTYDTASKSKSASRGMQSSSNSSSYVTVDEESEDASGALRAQDYNMEDSENFGEGSSGPKPPNQEQLDQKERESEQFDEIVERVLRNDPTLKQVVLDGRKRITGKLHDSEALWNALVGNKHVQRLSLRSCNFNDEEAASLSLALVDNTAVTHIWLGDNDITSEGVEYLIATLQSNETIVYLELAGNVEIDPDLQDEVKSILEPRENLYRSEPEIDEVETLMERVRQNDPTLTKLDLSSMGIGERDDAMSMFDNLAGNNYIQKVDLSSNGIDDDLLSSISLSLLDNTSITHLNLANNSINSEGAEYLIGTLNENRTLQEINLEGNQCDENVLEEINYLLYERGGSLSIASNKSSDLGATVRRLTANDPGLVELRLDGIDLMHSTEAERLIDALSTNTFVTTVSFDDTDMDDTLVAALSLALVDNQTISHLSLRDNQITNEGCEYLLGTLDSNTDIAYLDLSGNLIDEHFMNEIDAILSQRQSPAMDDDASLSRLLQRVKSNDPNLTELVLDGRPDDIHSNEFEAILDAVAHNSFVTKLSLRKNDVDDSLVAALSLALVDNTSISHVLLSDNQITNDGCEYILGTLDSNTTVSYIDLSGNFIDGHLMDEIDTINSSRNSRAAPPSPPTVKNAEPTRVESNIDLSKPPMHQVAEESDTELAKREAIQAIMRDTSIPWPEKNQRIIKLQQQYYVPKDENEEPAQAKAQAANAVVEDNIGSLIDRIMDNDPKLVEIELDGQDLNREDEAALFDALAQNSYVTSLSLMNCRITNEGAAELMYALGQNSTLTHINLEDNQITSNAALDLIAVLKEHNETVQYLELKDNKVRSGLLSQITKILEKRRPGYIEPMMAAATSYAQVAPAMAAPATSGDVESTSSNHKSGSRSSKTGKSKSRSRGDRHKSDRRKGRKN